MSRHHRRRQNRTTRRVERERSAHFLLAASLFLAILSLPQGAATGWREHPGETHARAPDAMASLGWVEILPENALIEVGRAEAFHAFAFHADGTPVQGGELVWRWGLETSAPGVGVLLQDDVCEGPNMVEFAQTQVEGSAVVKVIAELGGATRSAEARVTVTLEPGPAPSEQPGRDASPGPNAGEGSAAGPAWWLTLSTLVVLLLLSAEIVVFHKLRSRVG